MLKISVIIPVYKVEAYLDRCVESVLAQTYKDFELILVDDGSPDRCGEMCDEWAKRDARIRVIHQQNGGLSAARNAGIDWVMTNSDSEWITFIDSDDWVSEDYLSSLAGAVESYGTSVAVGGVLALDNDEQKLFEQTEYNDRMLSPEDLFIRFASLGTWAWNKLYRKSDFDGVRYPVGMVYEDRHTTHKILFKYDRVAIVNKPIYFYRVARPGNIVGENNVSIKNFLDRIHGLNCQIKYFAEHGFARAEACVIGDYFNWVKNRIETIESLYPERKDEIAAVRMEFVHRIENDFLRCARIARRSSLAFWNDIAAQYEQVMAIAHPERKRMLRVMRPLLVLRFNGVKSFARLVARRLLKRR